ncbi:hypothetical protein GQR58_028921 [Nymphon striatum]|nr:hypothetical protein GQR58_028921 [Nymphon striatum]
MELNPKLDYNYQMARIYGEQGDIDRMFSSYLSLIIEGKSSLSNVVRNIDDFITSDSENENNQKLKTILLQNAQKDPNVTWNQLLSWLFVQQKQYGSAFRQEKAIYKRMDGASIQRLENLGDIALEDLETDAAQDIFEYIIENTNDEVTRLNAQLNLIDIQLLDAEEKQLIEVQKQYEELNSLELPLNARGTAFVKLALGDILVFNKKFNQALIYFSQIQKRLKNDVLGQNARFKVAQTSFYKGDFDWSLTQLKVLRSSTSQLIANDAMQLSLLISDNSLEDSTQTALKKNKTKEAIDELNGILLDHKGEKIEDEALLKQSELLIKLKDSKFNYQKIIEFYATWNFGR